MSQPKVTSENGTESSNADPIGQRLGRVADVVAYLIICEEGPRHLTETRELADKFAPRVAGSVLPVVSQAAAQNSYDHVRALLEDEQKLNVSMRKMLVAKEKVETSFDALRDAAQDEVDRARVLLGRALDIVDEADTTGAGTSEAYRRRQALLADIRKELGR